MSAATRAFSFEWFSSLPAYRSANRAQIEAFLSDLRVAPPWQGIDVACGVGLMSELCHEIANKVGALLQRTICIDLDRQALDIAREKLSEYPAAFLQSVGQRLPLRDGLGSFLVIGNGIHNFSLDDKVDLFREAFRVLRDGAGLFFNSSFYNGAIVENTERFYVEKVRNALRQIVRSQAPRDDSSGEKPEAARFLTPDEYVELARDAGFTDVQYQEVEVPMDQELWEAISSYGQYAQGALHFRYPAEVACPALRQAVHDLFTDPNWDIKFPGLRYEGEPVIPRRWLSVTARKPRTK